MRIVTCLLALWAVTGDWWLRHLDTAIHEGGHALAAYLTGWRVRRIHIESDGGGFTHSYTFAPKGRPSRIAISVAGYTSPPLAGLASARLLDTGNVAAVFILAVLALGALLLVVENRFGILVVVVNAALLVFIGGYAPGWAGAWTASFLAWFLLMYGVKSVVTLHRARRHGGGGSDADRLGELTHIPAILWVGAFAAFSVWCLYKGAIILLG